MEMSTNKSCVDIQAMEYLVCDCIDQKSQKQTCAKTYSFTYTGEPCRGSGGGGGGSMNSNAVAQCTDDSDFLSLPSSALIIAKDASGNEFDRVNNVKTGSHITIAPAANGCIPDVIKFEIRDYTKPKQVHQRIAVDTTCAARGIQLADSAGALNFIGYTCGSGKKRNCLTEIASKCYPCQFFLSRQPKHTISHFPISITCTSGCNDTKHRRHCDASQ
jgi:hypothetical protein